jgi:simple sugar transport system ATP-binding protein
VDGTVLQATPSRCVAAGIAYIPEDRLETGVVGSASIWHNAVLREYRRPPVCRGILLRRRRAEQFARRLLEEARVAAPDVQMPTSRLSGGNVQRLLVTREARVATRALVAANPTRGLDVHATERVRSVLTQLRDRGAAILLISEDLDELLLLSDRLVVMYAGRIVGEFADGTPDRDRIGLLMAGSPAADRT